MTAAHRRAVLDSWHDGEAPRCLALVVRARGSSYRRPGALAVLDAQGFRAGTLSGGCLDAEIETAARDCLASARPQLLQLDTRSQEDLLFGSQSGCRGEIDILLWPEHAGAASLQRELAQADRLHRCLTLDFDLHPDRLGHWAFSDAAVTTPSDGVRLRLLPTPRLLLCGAGPEAPPLLRLAAGMGWWVEAIEHRGRFLAALQQADAVHPGRPSDALPLPHLDRFDAVVCMSHLYAEDLAALRMLAGSGVGWIGLLGPRARRDALLAELGSAAEALHGRLEGPVGEALGGDGPEALALSIGARLQRLFQQR